MFTTAAIVITTDTVLIEGTTAIAGTGGITRCMDIATTNVVGIDDGGTDIVGTNATIGMDIMAVAGVAIGDPLAHRNAAVSTPLTRAPCSESVSVLGPDGRGSLCLCIKFPMTWLRTRSRTC